MRQYANTLPEGTRYILYARKSNDREDRQVRSLPDQLELARQEAERSDLTIVSELVEAKSAKRPGQREEFARMVSCIEAGEADGILAWHPDRLARNAVDGGWLIDLLDRGKLKDLRFLNYHFDNSPEGKFALGMVFSQAKYYVDKLSGDVTRGMRQVRAEGGFPHYVPEGYKNVRGELGRAEVVVDQERFTLLRRAVDLILAEVYPPAEVLRLLNGWGYRTRTTRQIPGGPMLPSSFYRILHNPFYVGQCKDTSSADGWYRGRHEPLMTEEEFRRLQAIIGRSNALIYRKHAYLYARGLFACGNCGRPTTATLSKGRHGRGAWVYYHCANRSGLCTKRGTREEVINVVVVDLLRRITIPEELEGLLLEMTKTALRRKVSLAADADKVADERLAAAKAERERLLPLLLKGTIGEADYRAGKTRLDREVEALERQEADATTQISAGIESARNAISFAVRAAKMFAEGSPELKRRVVQLLTSKRVLTPNNPLLEPHPYLEELIDVGPKISTFKPPRSSSQSRKLTVHYQKFSVGAPNENRIEEPCAPAMEDEVLLQEIADGLATAILKEGTYFPPLDQEATHSRAPSRRA